MKLTLLPSDKGDCLFLEATDGTAILIDGGMPDTYVQYVRPFLNDWTTKNKRPLDLVYLSHIDEDHIAGILQLMDDIVAWRVFHHKKKQGVKWTKPDFPEPPEVARLWHNGFHDLIGNNAGEIGSMLAARAAQLSTSADSRLRNLGSDYQAIATSIPQSIKLTGRVSPEQLKIPLNGEFGGLLALVRDPADEIRLRGKDSPAIRLLGPFEEDLERLRDKWNEWLRTHKKQLAQLRRARDDDEALLGTVLLTPALDVDDELGARSKVTEENLASLMLSVRHKDRHLLLTGDGHSTDILEGLEHNGLMEKGKGLHVDVLKVQHHGSEHNMKRDFARRVTADHYVICGNGRHENPDLRVLDVIVQSRLGNTEQRSSNAETNDAFHVWFNCSVEFLKGVLADKKKNKQKLTEYEKAAKHFEDIEKKMKGFAAKSGGKLKLHFLKAAPLELTLN
jgi:hypothetical protein